MEENLRRLTDEIGGRVTGTPQMAKAVDWAVAAFRAAGIDVHTEKYTLPVTWSEGDTHLELLGPVKFPVRLASTGWSPPIPAGGIEATLMDIGYGTQDAEAGSLLQVQIQENDVSPALPDGLHRVSLRIDHVNHFELGIVSDRLDHPFSEHRRVLNQQQSDRLRARSAGPLMAIVSGCSLIEWSLRHRSSPSSRIDRGNAS